MEKLKILLKLLFSIVVSLFKNHSALAMENLALRQQLSIYRHSKKRPKIRLGDRLFWILTSRYWKKWKNALIIVKPETVIGWHRKGFKLYWTWKSRKRGPGRPKISIEIRRLIKAMANENPTWGAPRIHGELLTLGIEIDETTVSNYLKRFRTGKPPSQAWRTFLKNHMHNTFAIDFFTVPTATFRVLYVFIVLLHTNRKIVHFNVTANPTAEWAAQQIVEACPWDSAPKYLLRDRDGIYGKIFQNRVQGMGIEEVKITAQSPWQNPYCERVIGSIKKDCVNHLVVLNEDHLKHKLSEYFKYYHEDRTHLGLDKNSPLGRPVQKKPETGKVIALPRVGGLHHRYEWRKAA
jgi:transposase InsO family protein